MGQLLVTKLDDQLRHFISEQCAREIVSPSEGATVSQQAVSSSQMMRSKRNHARTLRRQRVKRKVSCDKDQLLSVRPVHDLCPSQLGIDLESGVDQYASCVLGDCAVGIDRMPCKQLFSDSEHYVWQQGVLAHALAKQCRIAQRMQAWWRKRSRVDDFWSRIGAFSDISNLPIVLEEIRSYIGKWACSPSYVPLHLLLDELKSCQKHWRRNLTVFEELNLVSPDCVHSLLDLPVSGDMCIPSARSTAMTEHELLVYLNKQFGGL